jgi:hypothetical protein
MRPSVPPLHGNLYSVLNASDASAYVFNIFIIVDALFRRLFHRRITPTSLPFVVTFAHAMQYMQPRSNYTVIYMTFRDVTRGVPENVRW